MTRLARIARRLQDERGASLVELAVSMGLLVLVGSIVMSSLSTSAKAGAHVDDQLRGLSDLQVVTERLSRDLRAARGVDPLATQSQLTVWIDGDADYRREPDENVTWRIQAGANAGQFDVERVVGPLSAPVPAVQVVGESLVSNIAFAYLANGVPTVPEGADAIQVDMEYDAVVGAYAGSNVVRFDVRLRNVE